MKTVWIITSVSKETVEQNTVQSSNDNGAYLKDKSRFYYNEELFDTSEQALDAAKEMKQLLLSTRRIND